MKIIEIPKKSGGTRTIYVQNNWDKHHNRLLAHDLQKILEQTPHYDVVQGFAPNRSPVTNAALHVGYSYTLSMDITDFFDNCTSTHLIQAGATGKQAEQATEYGAPRQGLSHSPIAANLAGTLLDADIIKFLGCSKSADHSYTRYADDLSISANDINLLLRLREQIPVIALKHGWKIKPSKTRLQSQKYGNRIVCGVSVGAEAISVPRTTKRKLRALKHQRPGSNKERGLAEWCKLKTPSPESHFDSKVNQTWLIQSMKEKLK